MSADSFVVFFGVRHQLSEEEFDACERKQHPWMILARQGGFHHYWGNFYEDCDRYILLIGHRIGVFGKEGLTEVVISPEEFARINKDVTAKLRSAGIEQAPSLHCLYEPDF